MRILIVVMAAFWAVDCVAENILFVGDSTVGRMDDSPPFTDLATGSELIDSLEAGGDEVRIRYMNTELCAEPGGSLRKIAASYGCLKSDYEWADKVFILAGGHDWIAHRTERAKREAIAAEIRAQVDCVWFDTTELMSDDWSEYRVDRVHLTAKGYERLFAEIGL